MFHTTSHCPLWKSSYRTGKLPYFLRLFLHCLYLRVLTVTWISHEDTVFLVYLLGRDGSFSQTLKMLQSGNGVYSLCSF